MIRLHCDRCGRYVQSIGQPKDLAVFKKEVICKHCEKMESKLSRLAESLENKWLQQMKNTVKEAKAELLENMAKIKSEGEKEEE